MMSYMISYILYVIPFDVAHYNHPHFGGDEVAIEQWQVRQCMLGQISRLQPGCHDFHGFFYEDCQDHHDKEINLHTHELHWGPWTDLIQNHLQLVQ